MNNPLLSIADQVCKRLRSNDARLVCLVMPELFGNIERLGVDKFNALLEAIGSNTTLDVLLCWGFGLQASHCHAVKRLLQTTQHLYACILAGNDLGNEGLELVCEGLSTNKSVSLLGLLGTGFSLRGCRALAALLRCSTTLTQVGASHNPFGDEGGILLAQAVADAGVLTRLELESCGLSRAGLEIMTHILDSSMSLTHFSLCNNPGFDEDVFLPRVASVMMRNMWNTSQRRASLLQIVRTRAFARVADAALQTMLPKPLPPLSPLITLRDANMFTAHYLNCHGRRM